MLRKLLKYDLANTLKFISIFYALAFFFAALTRIFGLFENSLIMEILSKICSGAAISMMFSIVINSLMRFWVRFKANFYGDESYLTHTLPIKREKLYLSKTLAAYITLLLSVGMIALTLFIAYYSKENIEFLKNMLSLVATTYNSTVIKILLAFLLIILLELICALQAGFMGIILGHKMNNAKTGFSVLFGFIVYIANQIIIVTITFIAALMNDKIMNLFYTIETIDIPTIKVLIYLAIGCYAFTAMLGYFISAHLFQKGVNVD